jgi:hypothetical protein
MGKHLLPGQDTNEILLRFGSTLPSARANYKAFVAGVISTDKHYDLIGGGLRRSLQSKNLPKTMAYDERVLGIGSFVEKIKKHDKTSGHLRVIPY